jgi:uncharacterized protein Veg
VPLEAQETREETESRMKKISFIGGSIEVYPDHLIIEEKALFSSKKTATVPFSDIKDVSAHFDH